MTQRRRGAWIGDRWMERSCRVRVQARELLTPALDADDPNAVDCLFGGQVARLKCDHHDRMAKPDKFNGESLDVLFKAADDRVVEVGELHDVQLLISPSMSSLCCD